MYETKLREMNVDSGMEIMAFICKYELTFWARLNVPKGRAMLVNSGLVLL